MNRRALIVAGGLSSFLGAAGMPLAYLAGRGESVDQTLEVVPTTRSSDSGLPGAEELYSGKLLPGEEATLFLRSAKLFNVNTVVSSNPVALQRSRREIRNVTFLSSGVRYDLFDYMALNRVAGLLIIKNEQVFLERYELGLDEAGTWPGMSVSKSVVSTLVGAAVAEGRIRSLDDQLTAYLPVLAGTAYEGVTVEQVLQMASGVAWTEEYQDANSDRRRVLRLQNEGHSGAILRFLAALPRSGSPGTVWNYSTGEAYLAGALVHAAVGRSLASYLEDRIWSRFGMERDATWWLDGPGGQEMAGTGFSACLRDYGRLGLVMLSDAGDTLPRGWVRQATTPTIVGRRRINYGYMWWLVPRGHGRDRGAFFAEGIFGQFIYIDPAERVVIVVLSARSKPTGRTPVDDHAFFNAVVAGLKKIV